MASTPLRLSLKVLGVRPGLLSSTSKGFEIRAAFISGKAMRTETWEKPKPWPYKERGYKNRHAFIDGTLKRLDENSKVILVEGMPGVGKTELAKSIAEELEFLHFPMVTMDNYYINEYGFDLRKIDHKLPPRLRSYDINDFVKNPKTEKAVFMQFMMFYMKYFQYVDALAHLLNTGQGVVVERSPYSDPVFADTMHQAGLLSRHERESYYEWREDPMLELMKPHLVIYLDVAPSAVEDKLKQRGKGEEKVFNKEFLEILDHNYKHGFLKSISEHAELLVYDWTTPGESETVVEDIERINFDRFDTHDPKMNDWRMVEDWDWCEKRWNYTHNREILENGLLNHYFSDMPAIMMSGEESEILDEVLESTPGEKYQPGYNEDLGDTGILFQTKTFQYGLPSKSK